MNANTLMRVLINRYHSNDFKGFLKHLPDEKAQQVATIAISSDDLSAFLPNPLAEVPNIHYSWFSPILKTVPKERLSLTLSAFPEKHQQGLIRLFPGVLPRPSLPDLWRTFLLAPILKELLPEEGLLPIELQPDSSLNILLKAKKEDLVELFDFLGIYDLADRIRAVVDRKFLTDLYSALKPRQRVFLRSCLHVKDKIIAPKLDLKDWQGDSRSLQELLHRRGMLRFGKALSGQSDDFLWRIHHILDTGRSASLQKYCSSAALVGVTPLLIQQVVNTYNFIHEGS